MEKVVIATSQQLLFWRKGMAFADSGYVICRKYVII